MTNLLKFPLYALAFSSLVAAQPASASDEDSAQAEDSLVDIDLPDGVSEDAIGQRSVDTIALQVLLDRSGHSPGVVDGYMGGNTRRAIRAYRRAHDLPSGDEVDRELMESLMDEHGRDIFQTYTITEDDVDGPFREIPESFRAKAEMDSLPYEDPQELLAEKFHMDREFLRAINPEADFSAAGTRIKVVSPGDQELEGEVARIEVDKEDSEVRALDADGKVIASYPATVGSDSFPSPNGSMEVRAVAPDPKYYFDPEGRDWGPDRQLTIAAGPNNPVGGTWIDLTKEGYGIHGSPDPQLIGKTTSHGCVRLTNWDAEELAEAVSEGVKVEFV